jgi:prevent-host-death family protein
MKRIGIAALKDHLSEHLRAVERGEEMEVTDRDRPIVRLIPAGRSPRPQILPARRPFAEIRRRKFPPADWGVSSLELLLEKRQSR